MRIIKFVPILYYIFIFIFRECTILILNYREGKDHYHLSINVSFLVPEKACC